MLQFLNNLLSIQQTMAINALITSAVKTCFSLLLFSYSYHDKQIEGGVGANGWGQVFLHAGISLTMNQHRKTPVLITMILATIDRSMATMQLQIYGNLCLSSILLVDHQEKPALIKVSVASVHEAGWWALHLFRWIKTWILRLVDTTKPTQMNSVWFGLWNSVTPDQNCNA